MRKPVLIDGKNLLFRSHYANAGLSFNGQPTAALYSFIQSMRTIERHMPEASLVVVWESGALLKRVSGPPAGPGLRNWRYSILKEYKGDRKHNPESANALAQVPTLVRMIRLLGYRQIEVPGLEADDLAALAATQLSKVNTEVFIYSNDRDFNQLLGNKRIKLLRPWPAVLTGGPPFKTYTESDLLAEWEVPASRWCQFRALSGDASDHIKALKGIGPKKALVMLKAGVDASQEYAKLPSTARQFSEILEPNWKKVQDCYRVSVIPKELRELPPMPLEVVQYAGLELNRITRKTHRRIAESRLEEYKLKLLGICADNGLRQFVADLDQMYSGVDLY